MRTKNLLIAATLFALTSCTATHRGVVAMKISDDEVHVCLGKGEVKEGDSVAIFRNDCPPPSTTKTQVRGTSSCTKKEIGTGTITQVLNEHYSVAKLSTNTPIKEGDVVERK